ncbi:zinc-binding protein A33-like [Trachinotus anak]|uniref:zinc-binding protein A33-like n=1 Tax=Trachinotus anak TaxID=443729 RepID=UPI0039F18258
MGCSCGILGIYLTFKALSDHLSDKHVRCGFSRKVKVKNDAKSVRLSSEENIIMASEFYSRDLTCLLCLMIFTDPVTLLCGHSFCRQCITDVLKTHHQCPQCQTAVAAEGTCVLTSYILRSVTEKTKEAETMKKQHEHEVAELRPEHEEKLKLFCVTDQQLACIICRDGERHKGHKFKPIREVAASVRRELEMFVKQVSDDICAIESLANTQREEITETKETSQQLMTQIYRQFEEMHQFLRKREDEIKKDLKHKEEEAVEKMSETLNAMEMALSENRELEGKVTSVLKITDAERFLKSWTEENSTMSEKHSLRPRGRNLQVVNTSLSLGPHESHLQFFMWKEMLQVIQPRAAELSLQTDSRNITVSEDGLSLLCFAETSQLQSNPFSAFSKGFGQRVPLLGTGLLTHLEESKYVPLSNYASSVNQFSSGQHCAGTETCGLKDQQDLRPTIRKRQRLNLVKTLFCSFCIFQLISPSSLFPKMSCCLPFYLLKYFQERSTQFGTN